MIRKATLDDIPAIREMAGIVFRKTYSEILSPEQLEYMFDMMYSEESLLKQMTAEGNIFLIEDGKGYASYRYQELTEDGRDVFHLEKLYVMPSEQGTGLGKRLFDVVVSEVLALSAGHPRIELNVNRNNSAVGFYEHIGMHRAFQGDFPIGKGFYMNDFIMAIDL